jgi:hypothetical protein
LYISITADVALASVENVCEVVIVLIGGGTSTSFLQLPNGNKMR